MQIIIQPTSLLKIWEERETPYDEVLKIVVDLGKNIIAVDGEMHADLEQLLLDHGSFQQNLWGANIFPLRKPQDQLEYTSLINIRPAMGNRSMEVSDQRIREKIKEIVEILLK
ncbi:MAG: hypothetical protein FJY10_00505 [Bacteroidetes bacterium]|nr:hypothetical protein [Bacteroidota bacterium]